MTHDKVIIMPPTRQVGRVPATSCWTGSCRRTTWPWFTAGSCGCHRASATTPSLSFDPFDSPLIRVLIDARGLPEQVLHIADEPARIAPFRIRDLTQRGWLLLGEQTVLGSVSQPWKARGAAPRAPVPPEKFPGFDEPDSRRSPSASASTRTAASILTRDASSADRFEQPPRFLRYWRVGGRSVI